MPNENVFLSLGRPENLFRFPSFPLTFFCWVGVGGEVFDLDFLASTSGSSPGVASSGGGKNANRFVHFVSLRRLLGDSTTSPANGEECVNSCWGLLLGLETMSDLLLVIRIGLSPSRVTRGSPNPKALASSSSSESPSSDRGLGGPRLGVTGARSPRDSRLTGEARICFSFSASSFCFFCFIFLPFSWDSPTVGSFSCLLLSGFTFLPFRFDLPLRTVRGIRGLPESPPGADPVDPDANDAESKDTESSDPESMEARAPESMLSEE